MSLRVLISPSVQTGNVCRSKAESYCNAFVNFYPSNEDGTPASAWILTVGRAADWAAADADAQVEVVFPVPGSVSSRDELVTWLRTVTIGDMTAQQRSAMQAVFDNHGIHRADFTLSTSGAKVMRRLVSACVEQDFNFGLGFVL